MGKTQYAYDREGNLLSERGVRKTAQYGYNGASRMTLSSVTDLVAGSRTISHYAYDAFGRRTLVQDDGGEMVRSLYDGLSFDVLRENVTFTDGSFTTKFTTEALKANEPTVSSDRYVWIGDDSENGRTTQGSDGKTRALHYTGMQVGLYAYGQSVAMNRSASGGSGNATRGGIAYFGSDVLGSVRSATDEYGSIEGRYEYDAFGKPYKGDFTTGLNAGYTGKPYDSVTGLYNYGYRDYKPETARFTTVDPIKDGNNWYAYVNNDPISWLDPFGLSASDVKKYEPAELKTKALFNSGEFESPSVKGLTAQFSILSGGAVNKATNGTFIIGAEATSFSLTLSKDVGKAKISIVATGPSVNGVVGAADKGTTKLPVVSTTGFDVGLGATLVDVGIEYRKDDGFAIGVGFSDGAGFQTTNKDGKFAADIYAGIHLYIEGLKTE
jgi:RHS repeat-associated protein